VGGRNSSAEKWKPAGAIVKIKIGHADTGFRLNIEMDLWI